MKPKFIRINRLVLWKEHISEETLQLEVVHFIFSWIFSTQYSYKIFPITLHRFKNKNSSQPSQRGLRKGKTSPTSVLYMTHKTIL